MGARRVPAARIRVVHGVVLAGMLGLTPLFVQALEPGRHPVDYVMRGWGAAEGLPQQTVNALLQTRDGYLWVGTQDGLFRFDVVRFVPFDGEKVPELASNWVTALLEDRLGRLWVGTYGGGLSVRDGHSWYHLGPTEGLPGRNVQALCEDEAHRIWVGTEAGLAVCDPGGCVDSRLHLPVRDVTALLTRISHHLPAAGEDVPATLGLLPAAPPATCLEHASATPWSQPH